MGDFRRGRVSSRHGRIPGEISRGRRRGRWRLIRRLASKDLVEG